MRSPPSAAPSPLREGFRLHFLPSGGPSHDSPLKAAVGVADENLGALHLTCDPPGVADGVRPLPIPEAERSASGGLQQPFATMMRVRDALEDYGLGTGQFSPLAWNWNPETAGQFITGAPGSQPVESRHVKSYC